MKKDPRILLGLSINYLLSFSSTWTLASSWDVSSQAFKRGFFQLPLRSLEPPQEKSKVLANFCQKLHHEFRKLGWRADPCGSLPWEIAGMTPKENPLIYLSLGEGSLLHLFLGGVHPDEVPTIEITLRLAHHLNNHPHLLKGHRVIMAPLVNPDGFFLPVKTRTNSQGVDLNRNFLTGDWYGKAHKYWTSRSKRRARYRPGRFPESEVETQFQIFLMEKYRPHKVMSLHAPLGFYDYDGPSEEIQKPSSNFVYEVAAESGGYPVVAYKVFPGSLGNYAGTERNIPTITLELESTDAQKVDSYWKQFLPGFLHSISYTFQGVFPHASP